jgi:sulfotransferase
LEYHMQNGIHFIAGLPRSGSTLLGALLRQNPRIHSPLISPVAALLNGLTRQMSQENETGIFIDDAQRIGILTACVEAFYEDVQAEKIVFDRNREWTGKLALLTALYPDAKVICCIRNPAWVLDSLERQIRSHPTEPSSLYAFDTAGNVYSRAEHMMAGQGFGARALNSLREAAFDERRERLMLVRFESLTSHPIETLNAIYDFIGEPAFPHDPNNIEEDFDAYAYDARLGAPELHQLRPSVQPVTRATVLPPDLFRKYEQEAFWERSEDMPSGLRLV